ncbi:hypothetical protein PILCRDRAFT_811958 [Piloderma croceum F 1598]|uniref:Uncharacterized protein n=1 Tax=Piloderma croceum (strain F 1598) TaxID=765440 RepID=A0A0C3BUN1_PILCF|nr:hypothetical protein PILCRDRAFT_811958 [Piloderma croceum F 1598]
MSVCCDVCTSLLIVLPLLQVLWMTVYRWSRSGRSIIQSRPPMHFCKEGRNANGPMKLSVDFKEV